jgi:hypothetical protein
VSSVQQKVMMVAPEENRKFSANELVLVEIGWLVGWLVGPLGLG